MRDCRSAATAWGFWGKGGPPTPPARPRWPPTPKRAAVAAAIGSARSVANRRAIASRSATAVRARPFRETGDLPLTSTTPLSLSPAVTSTAVRMLASVTATRSRTYSWEVLSIGSVAPPRGAPPGAARPLARAERREPPLEREIFAHRPAPLRAVSDLHPPVRDLVEHPHPCLDGPPCDLHGLVVGIAPGDGTRAEHVQIPKPPDAGGALELRPVVRTMRDRGRRHVGDAVRGHDAGCILLQCGDASRRGRRAGPDRRAGGGLPLRVHPAFVVVAVVADDSVDSRRPP